MATNYYVDGILGDDTNAGTSEGSGNALRTIQAGALKMTAVGDHLYIKAGVTYLAANTTSPSNGSAQFPKIFEGYTSTPGDGGGIVIDGANTTSNGMYTYASHIIFRNITCKRFTGRGFNMSGADYIGFENCHALDNGTYGFHVDNYITFDRCTSIGNRYGLYCDQRMIATNCYIYNNDTYGTRCGSYMTTLINCVVAGGSSYVIFASNQLIMLNCTVDGFGTDKGVQFTGTYPSVIQNCIFHDCTTAITGNNASGVRANHIGNNNMMSGNTTDYLYWDRTDTDFEGTPDFTDEANGDYTLGASSDALGAGFGGLGQVSGANNIGAYQSAASGGGSSQIILVG